MAKLAVIAGCAVSMFLCFWLSPLGIVLIASRTRPYEHVPVFGPKHDEWQALWDARTEVDSTESLPLSHFIVVFAWPTLAIGSCVAAGVYAVHEWTTEGGG